MKKLTWGIVLVVLGLLSFLGAGNNPQGPAASIVAGSLLVVGGALLAYFGWRARGRKKLVVERAFRMLRESNTIRTHELALGTGVSEMEVRQHLAEAQRSGLIPFKTEFV